MPGVVLKLSDPVLWSVAGNTVVFVVDPHRLSTLGALYFYEFILRILVAFD